MAEDGVTCLTSILSADIRDTVSAAAVLGFHVTLPTSSLQLFKGFGIRLLTSARRERYEPELGKINYADHKALCRNIVTLIVAVT